MRGFTKLLAAMLAAGGAELAAAAPPDELADLATRIEYGFYGDEPRVIEAARAELERFGEDDAVRFYLGFAAFRLAQLHAQRGADASALLDACIESATPASPDNDSERAAEGWLVVAACASLGGETRRRDQALERARAIDTDNPRIALLAAWAVSSSPQNAAPAVRDAAAAQLEKAVAAFAAWDGDRDTPQWGEAEALAELGGIALQRGEARTARDLLERALLLAPDYRVAVDLRGKLQASRARN
jgi:tetratricopeptide (TPR) repeat protein